jgi:hypothetical protein
MLSIYLKVLVKCFSAPITGVTTDLTLVLNAQSMQLVQPKWYRLTIPAQR